MAETAALLGRGEDEEYYRDIADKMKAAIQKGVIREDGSLPVDLWEDMCLPSLLIWLQTAREKRWRNVC